MTVDRPEPAKGGSLRSHPLYRTWVGMLDRTRRPTATGYEHYGGRGIVVCQEWHDSATFLTWIDENLGPRPEGCTLDRIDNDGNYEPDNVRWADASEQSRNQRKRVIRSTRMVDDPIAKAAVAYRRDQADEALSRAALYDAIRDALKAGRTQSDCARVCGFTRETIKKISQGK